MKDPHLYDIAHGELSWCPGCGDFQILEALKLALAELDLDPRQVVAVSGIGQAAKLPHYLRTHFFNGLHGRALPCATAIKASNPALTVIAVGGDGDMYGEGGNHFVHAIRRNPDIANFVHNNMVYGLTKGQFSPTSPRGFKTPTSPDGVTNQPLNPIAVAIALGASFVARAFSGNVTQTKEIMKQAITHRGYALVDIFQPCVSFNKVNTFKWYKDHTYDLEAGYDPTDRDAALAKAFEEDSHALGVLYLNPRATFVDNLAAYGDSKEPLYGRAPDFSRIDAFVRQSYGL